MESGNHLGIYWSKNKATVVCLAPPGRERKVLDCFSVVADGEQQGQQALADRIVEACRQRKIKFTSAAVALDCASFMQHTVHSEFRDPKRIAATIRFDTEEALGTDISEMAVSFRVTFRHGRRLESRCVHGAAVGAVGYPAVVAEQRDRPGGRGPRCLLPGPLSGAVRQDAGNAGAEHLVCDALGQPRVPRRGLGIADKLPYCGRS